jgi:hypothetical protein
MVSNEEKTSRKPRQPNKAQEKSRPTENVVERHAGALDFAEMLLPLLVADNARVLTADKELMKIVVTKYPW